MYENKCLYWEEGMLLQPQHFQIMGEQRTYSLATLAHMVQPFAYGIRTLRIAQETLPLGSFALEALDVVLPSGEHLILGENTFVPASNFFSQWTDAEAPLYVFLALPLTRYHEANVTASAQEQFPLAKTRYVALEEPQAVQDVHGGNARADVHFMHYNARILFSQQSAIQEENTFVLPLALLERHGDGVRLVTEYVPPCVNIRASKYLSELVQDIRNIVLARVKQLEDYKLISSGQDDASYAQNAITVRTLGLYTMLAALSQSLPLLEQYLEADAIHPWQVYGLLRQLVGQLSLFSADISALGENIQGQRTVPPYQHTELGQCFSAVHLIISRLMGSLATGPAHTLNFEELGQNQWFCRIPPHVCATPYSYWLQIRTGDNSAGLREHVERWAKLAPADQLTALITKSLPGLRIRAAETPPAGLPRRNDIMYFFIDQQDSLWGQTMISGQLGLFLPNMPAHVVIHLTVLQIS